jgi:predicted RNA-binding Zn ribbon-like protein
LQAGLTAGEAQREEEARKAAEAKATEKKRKRDEGVTTGALSPRTLEKKRRKDERDAIRKEKLPLITLAEEGIPTELAYTGAKSTIRHNVSTNFARGVEWGTLSKAEQRRVTIQVKGAFQNGGELDSQWIADKISNLMSQARYHDRMKIRAHLRDLNVYRNLERPLQFSEDIWNAFYQSEVQLKAARQLKEITEQLAKAKKAREFGRFDRDLKALELKLAECQLVVDEVGDPPLKFLKAAERVKLVPPTTHRLGQGGIPSLKAAFVSILPLFHFFLQRFVSVESHRIVWDTFAMRIASQR